MVSAVVFVSPTGGFLLRDHRREVFDTLDRRYDVSYRNLTGSDAVTAVSRLR